MMSKLEKLSLDLMALSTSTRSIIGRVFTKHSVDVVGKTNEEVKATIGPSSNFKKATEIKVAVVETQIVGIGHSPHFVLEAQLQSISSKSCFNKNVKLVVRSLFKRKSTTSLVKVAADGFSFDVKITQGKLATFLQGLTNHVALIDSNYNGKNF